MPFVSQPDHLWSRRFLVGAINNVTSPTAV
jgi:hypothetical protein